MGGWTNEWTQVRYGRRRQRNNGPGMWRADWGRARAPPASNRRWGSNPRPNPPVPPPGNSTRYRGPQSRSYADVTRQPANRAASRNRAPNLGGNRSNQGRQQQPTDPKFGKLVRQLHAVIKMVHHLQNVAQKPGTPEPVMISRMVDTLSTMIKPASPTENTTDLIMGNAKNWGYTTLLILEDHYTTGLETLLSDLTKDLTKDWKTAFLVATRWAKRNLPRMTQDVVDHAEALISTCAAMEEEEDSDLPQSLLDSDIGALTESPRSTLGPQRPQGPQQTQACQTDNKKRPQTVTKHTVATMTNLTSDWSPEPLRKDTPPPPITPLERRSPLLRRRRTPGVVPEDSFDFEIVSLVDDTPVPRGARGVSPSVSQRPLEMDLGHRSDRTPTLTPVPIGSAATQERRPELVIAAVVHRAPSPRQQSPERNLAALFDDSLVDFSSTPEPQTFQVNRHPNTDRKMVDWSLRVDKKWLLLGDSNLSRIPGHKIPDLQVESYPGANFRHAQAIISKSNGSTLAEKVILAFGLNCRGQTAKVTSIKQMQGAVRTAKKLFPYAEIWIPVVNYSASLTPGEQLTLRLLNAHILRNMPSIPALAKSQFRTEDDHVHWTKETARAMLNHWAECLNLKAP